MTLFGLQLQRSVTTGRARVFIRTLSRVAALVAIWCLAYQSGRGLVWLLALKSWGG